MKKILATVLCLTITTPCFAFDRRHAGPHPIPMNPPAPHMQMHHPQPRPVIHHHHHHRMSNGAKVAGAIVGVTGLAILVAALAD